MEVFAIHFTLELAPLEGEILNLVSKLLLL